MYKSEVKRKIYLAVFSVVTVCLFALGCIFSPKIQSGFAQTNAQAYFLYSDSETLGCWYIGEKTSKADVSNRIYGKSGLMIPYQRLVPLRGGAGNPTTDLEEINDFSETSSVNEVEYPSWLSAENGIVSDIRSGVHGYWLSSTASSTQLEHLLKRPDTTKYADTTTYVEKSFQQLTEAELEYTFNVTDDNWHQVAVYCKTMVGWTVDVPNCTASVAITDLNGKKLAGTIAQGYDNGVWYVFAVKGSFIVRLDKLGGGSCGLAGIFLDEMYKGDDVGVSNLGAMRQGVKDIHLGWVKKSADTLSLIYRKESKESGFAPIAFSESNTYIDTATEPSSVYTYMIAPAKKRVMPSSIMEQATALDKKAGVGAYDVRLPDETLSVSKETAPYDLTKIEFEKSEYIVLHGGEVTAKATVYVQKNGVYEPYPNVEVYFTLDGDDVYSSEGITAYPNMNTDLAVATTDGDGAATFTYRQPYAGNYRIVASVNAVPDVTDPEKGTAASSASVSFTQMEENDAKIPVLWTVSDAIKPGDSVTLTGNNLLPNADLKIAYAPSVGASLARFDEDNEPDGCKYLTIEDLIVTDSVYETGLSFVFPATESAGAYDMWVKTSYGWSEGVTMNAARPLFINQDGAYEGVTVEIVGRNFYVSDFGIGTRENAPSQIQVKLVRIGDVNGNADGITEEKIVGVRTDVRIEAENAVNGKDIDWTNPYKISFVVPKVNYYGRYALYVAADGVVYRGLQQPQTLTVYERKAQSWDETVFGAIAGNAHVGNDPLDLGYYWAQDLNYTNVATVQPNNAPGEALTQDAGVIATTNDVTAKMTALSANGGGVLYFPEGNYYLTTINIPANVMLVGAGQDKTKLYYISKTGGGFFIKSLASNVGVARMHLEIYEHSLVNPDWIVNLSENSSVGANVDPNLSTVNKFMVDCSTKFRQQFKTNGTNTRAMIGLGGKQYILMQNCFYDGGNNPLYASYSQAYATMRNVVAVNIFGMSVAPTIQHSYTFVENVYADLCDDGHAFSLRDCAYIADSFVTGSGSYGGANIGEMIVFEPAGGYYGTGKILSATERTFTMALSAGERIDQYTYYKYNGIAIYITEGKGAGQMRYFKNIPINMYGNEYEFVEGEKAWDIIPDSTSKFTVLSPMENATVYRFAGTQNKKAIFLYSGLMDAVVAECNLWETEGIYVCASDVNVTGRFVPTIGVRIENNVLRGVSPMTGEGGIGIRSERSGDSWGMQIMNVSIRGNQLIDVGGDDPYYRPQDSEMPSQRGIAIVTGSTDSGDTAGDVRFVTIENNVVTGGEYGVYCESRLTGFVVRNNLIQNVEAEEEITYFAPEQTYVTGIHTFYVDGNETQDGGEYIYGTSLPTVADTADGVFLGWSLTETYNHEKGVTLQAYGANTTLYAIYGKKVEFNLNYIRNNGNAAGVFNTVKVATGYTVERQIAEFGSPFRVGYVFGGWFLDAECTQKFVDATVITENTTLYAKWTDKNAAPDKPKDEPPANGGANVLPWIIVGVSVGVIAVAGAAVLIVWKKKKRP